MYKRIQVSFNPIVSLPVVLLFVILHVLCFVPNTNHFRLCSSHTYYHACQAHLARNHFYDCHASFELPAATSTRRVVAYIAGGVHDTVCMRLFAAGLLATGLKDEAAGVYYSLLQEGADRAQQVVCSHCSSLDVCI